MTYFELVGGTGCPVCGPWVGTLATDQEPDEVTSFTLADLAGSGVFHDGCTHDWSEVSGNPDELLARRGEGRYDAEEREAVKDYQLSSYGLNEALRHPRTIDEATRRSVAALDRAVARSPRYRTAQTLFRGVDRKEYARLERAALDGKLYQSKAFVSTTSDRGVAEQFGGGFSGDRVRVVEIRVPAGTLGLRVDEHGLMNSGAAEVLLARGSKFRASFAPNRIDIVLELVP